MTNHRALADLLARGSSPTQIAAALEVPLVDVEQRIRELQTILRGASLASVRDRLVQMGYGSPRLAPWSAAAFHTSRRSTDAVTAA
ncbi:hypothetical protein ACXVUM_09085 [Williamsia sp. SKLECPSW1]